MPNFFLDNDDLMFLFDHLDLGEVARVQEDDFEDARVHKIDYAPVDEADTIDNYRRVLEILGDIAGNAIAPRAEAIDDKGNTLNEDGTVTLNPLVAENLKALSQADLMGFTLPRRFGGLNCPNIIYSMANDIVSRADGSLMNIFGLQGIAETINAFADEEIKDEFLPRFSRGEVTGAMVLTEPDAGSDLQAVRLKAIEENGQWYLRGVKRFITNGCGEVLLVLARSEPDISDGRGLSLFITERNACVKVRHLEHKLGIHGSPTCELVFDDCPARLIGQRQRGLITYVMALMNGARLGIAAQSLGIAESAYRLARTYANTRKQFGGPIERLPAVAEMVTDMKIAIEAARALTYETCRVCDLDNNNQRVLEFKKPTDPAEVKERKALARTFKRLNGMLTPLAKYYASEVCCMVADKTIQVLGGSGYMRDYPAERYLRDARITTIYEGTSQLQIVAAVRGVCSGAFERRINEFEQTDYDDVLLSELKTKLVEGKEQVLEAIKFVKSQSTDYLDLMGRKLVDAAAAVFIGHLFLHQAKSSVRPPSPAGSVRPPSPAGSVRPPSLTDWSAMRARKKRVAKHFIDMEMPKLRMNCEMIHTGDRTPLEEYDLLAGPVPAAD
ncbi:MAG: acyl-CoA dehydrogenase family protein [Phycisphaerae bacterium]|nr:acyl-CoA dehydrogenase family protein [Phycisphaerae bacterium]